MKFKIQYSSTKLMPIWNLKISIISSNKFQIRSDSNLISAGLITEKMRFANSRASLYYKGYEIHSSSIAN